MPYASGRPFQDADSHLMELPDFLRDGAPQRLRAKLPSLTQFGLDVEGLRFEALAGQTRHPDEVVAARRALGDSLLKGPKWHDALGSFCGEERAEVLDLLGFDRQVIFSSFCATALFPLRDPVLRVEGCRAHNRSLAAFCDADPRLLGVGLLTLDDPAAALATIEEGLELGLAAFWLPSEAPGGRSPGHPEHDPVWRRLAEAETPFLLHVGSTTLSIADEWTNDGMPAHENARGGAEVIGSKDLAVIYQPYERFLSILLLDGVLERFPALRGGAIEVGAGWVPAMCRRLDHAASIWARSEPHLARMERRPSEQIEAQLRFTPYPFEDVGQLIRESSPSLYLFSSDYPHAEGGRDPLARFEASLAGHGEETRRRFFADNMCDLYGAA